MGNNIYVRKGDRKDGQMQNNEKKKLIERISVMSGVSTLNKPPLFILFMTKTATASLHEIIFTEASSPGMKIASNLNGSVYPPMS